MLTCIISQTEGLMYSPHFKKVYHSILIHVWQLILIFDNIL